jgi:hypothetical protein
VSERDVKYGNAWFLSRNKPISKHNQLNVKGLFSIF